MKGNLTVLTLLLILSIAFFACNDSSEPAVQDGQLLDVTPSVTLVNARVTGNSLLNISYSWTTGPNFQAIGQDLRAKIHFIDPNGQIYFQDDHGITPDVSKWKSGQTYTYERIVYVPLFPRIMELAVTMGLYNEDNAGKRFLLNGTAFSPGKYNVATVSISPPRRPEDLPGKRISYLSGWYDLETDLVSHKSWRWMSSEGKISLQNPERNADLFIRGWLPSDELGKASHLKILQGEDVLGDYPGLRDGFEIHLPIPSSFFQNQDQMELSFLTDSTYIPSQKNSGADQRELGAMINILYFN